MGRITIAAMVVFAVGVDAFATRGVSRADESVRTGGVEYLCQIPPPRRAAPPPAEAPAAQAAAVPRKIESLPGPSFEFGKAELTGEGRRHVERVVQAMRADPTLRISVEGHTDSVGTHDRNMLLSKLRADAVRDYLVSHGIQADRITTQGFAETRPIADNDTAAGHAMNRRVEIVAQ